MCIEQNVVQLTFFDLNSWIEQTLYRPVSLSVLYPVSIQEVYKTTTGNFIY